MMIFRDYTLNVGRKALLLAGALCFSTYALWASSHREAPLIADDTLADNTDLYAFRSPDNPDMITNAANYIPAELPYGGSNYFSFGQNIRYEIHLDNDAYTPGFYAERQPRQTACPSFNSWQYSKLICDHKSNVGKRGLFVAGSC